MSSSSAFQFDFVVPPELAGERLDRAMSAVAENVTRGEARRLIAAGVVFVGGRRTGICSRRVHAGERLSWNLPSKPFPSPSPSSSSSSPRIVLERDDLWIIDKPAGMPVEPTRSGARGTLVEWLRPHGGGLVAHRLDVATSGLIVVARERDALVELNALFAAHRIERRYLAVITPAPDWPSATFDQPLDGRSAVTHARVIARGPLAAMVELVLETGRTQQIRRHLRGAGHPVVGETPEGTRTGRRLLLHAHTLSIPWARSGRVETLRAVAPPPEDFATPSAALGISFEISELGSQPAD
ncbi:MAG TPA: RluA family pseudouridine synthase [Polyangia bacterium]